MGIVIRPHRKRTASAHLEKIFAFKLITQESIPALIEFVNVFKEIVAVIKSIGAHDIAGLFYYSIWDHAYSIQPYYKTSRN